MFLLDAQGDLLHYRGSSEDVNLFFWRLPPNSPNHMNSRPDYNEKRTAKYLLMKIPFFSTNNGSKTMLIAH